MGDSEQGKSRFKSCITNAKIGIVTTILVMVLTFVSRKIFLTGLGAEFIGLGTSVAAFFSLLNISELGLSSAACYILYAPLREGNRQRVAEIVASFTLIYKCIGFIIICVGIIALFWFKSLIGVCSLSDAVVYSLYFSFLISAAIPYIFSSRQIILTADQNQYVITGVVQILNILKIIIQIIFVCLCCNLYIWIFIEFLYSIGVSLMINLVLRKKYKYLNSSFSVNVVKELFRNTKLVAVQKLTWVARYQLTELIVLKYTTLTYVAFYQNYALLCTRLISLSTQAYSGIPASVGSLIAEGNVNKLLSVFKSIVYLRVFTTSYLVLGLYDFADSFIYLWLGSTYIIDGAVLLCICSLAFVDHLRTICESFLFAAGLFNDTQAAVIEVILTGCLAIFLGAVYGICGVLCGVILSNIVVGYMWKPYYLFARLFGGRMYRFYFYVLPPILLSFCSHYVSTSILSRVMLISQESWGQFIISVTLYSLLMLFCMLLMYGVVFREFRLFLIRCFN